MIVQTIHCDNPFNCSTTTLASKFQGWFAIAKQEECITVTPMKRLLPDAFHACCFDCAMKIQHKLMQSDPQNEFYEPETQKASSQNSVIELVPRRGTCPICEEEFICHLSQSAWDRYDATGELPIEVTGFEADSIRQGICIDCLLASQSTEITTKEI